MNSLVKFLNLRLKGLVLKIFNNKSYRYFILLTVSSLFCISFFIYPSNFSTSQGSSEKMVKHASTTNIIYQEDFENNQGFWNLHNVTNPSFIIHSSKIENYISNVEDTYFPWIYTGTSFNLDSQDIYPTDIFFHDGFWWMCGQQTNRVYKYNEDWVYTGESFYLGTEDTSPNSIYFHNGFWWMCGDENDRVYKYSSNWIYTGESHHISFLYENTAYTNPTDICFHKGYWYVCAAFEYIIKKYTENWIFVEEYDIDSQWTNFINDIYFFDGHWWVSDAYYDRVIKYSENWIYTGESYHIGHIGSIVFQDGYWWRCNNNNGLIYKYYFQKELSKFAYKDDYTIVNNSFIDIDYSYMQTNTSEILTLRSIDLNLTIVNNSFIDIEFIINAISNITFSLIDSGLVKKSFTLSPLESFNFAQRKVIEVNEELFINQLEFSGLFNDTNSLILDSITIYNIYNIEEENPEVISFGSFYLYYVLILVSLIVLTTFKRHKKMFKSEES